jgi:hypothetical protein
VKWAGPASPPTACVNCDPARGRIRDPSPAHHRRPVCSALILFTSAVGGLWMPAKQRRYTGELAKPIVWPNPPTFWGAVTEQRVHKYRRDYENHQRKAKQRVNEKLLQKMSLLMKRFKIADEGDAASLAWALAFEHVPGFKIVPERKAKRGRKKDWHGGKLRALHDAVQSVKQRHKFNDRQALKFISNNSQWSEIWGPPSGYKGSSKQWIETLESRLQDAKRYITYIESLPETLEKMHTGLLREKFRKL